jgi:hypothetical protein
MLKYNELTLYHHSDEQKVEVLEVQVELSLLRNEQQ